VLHGISVQKETLTVLHGISVQKETLTLLHGISVQSFINPNNYVLVPFAKLRKAAVSFIMSVCLSVRMKQLGFLEMYFIEFEN
jgi:hypothetical protein